MTEAEIHIKRKTETALSEIRLQLQNDGGDIELVSIDKDAVTIRLKGACQGCPMAAITLKSIVERLIKDRVPEIQRVNSVD